MGRILNTHYNSKELAAELIDGGDMSSCWTDDSWTTDMIGCIRVKEDKYGPQYYSQRGDDCSPRYDISAKTYLETGEEYAYLYTLKGEWVCYNMNQFDDSKLPEIVEIPSAALHV